MKNLLPILFALFSLNSYTQNGYEVTTLDSIVTTHGSQGVYGLSTIVKDKKVHLTYIHGIADTTIWQLIYEVRKSGQQLSREIVYQFPANPWLDPQTCIQFDSDGDPYIYCPKYLRAPEEQHDILVANKKAGNWQFNTIDYRHRNNWAHTSGDVNYGLGFVTERQGDYTNNWQPVIDYFSLENDIWTSYTLSSSPFPKSRPVSFHNGNEVYVGFAEERNDTVKVYVEKKIDGNWHSELELTFPQYAHANNHWCKFGLSNGKVHFFHTYDLSTYSQPLTHLVETFSGWEEVPIAEGREQYHFQQWQAGNNIDVDNDGIFYFAHRGLVFSLDQNNVYQQYPNSLNSPWHHCYDMAIIDDELYLYITYGLKGWPYGDPVFFYEAIGSLSAITSVEAVDHQSVAKYVLSPNPGNGDYVLELDMTEATTATVQWFTLQGKQISQANKYPLHKGTNTIRMNNVVAESGIYFIRVTTAKGTIMIPLVQTSGK